MREQNGMHYQQLLKGVESDFSVFPPVMEKKIEKNICLPY